MGPFGEKALAAPGQGAFSPSRRLCPHFKVSPYQKENKNQPHFEHFFLIFPPQIYILAPRCPLPKIWCHHVTVKEHRPYFKGALNIS